MVPPGSRRDFQLDPRGILRVRRRGQLRLLTAKPGETPRAHPGENDLDARMKS
ncbi:MAG: hypothetical protein Ct9H300mP32_6820 [Verrucomicrobiota bacterium]|nr:MAG: hypothetical protein Ct9H300mP32_6820 [Verrucomicrobiota bacterium]